MQKYDTDTQKYDTDTQKYDTDTQKYDTDMQNYDRDTQKYDTYMQKYDTDTQKYDTDKQKYDTDTQKYDSDKQTYDTDTQNSNDSLLFQWNRGQAASKQANKQACHRTKCSATDSLCVPTATIKQSNAQRLLLDKTIYKSTRKIPRFQNVTNQ